MEVATFVIAVFGAVTGGGSLAWEVWSFFLSGPKVGVSLESGRMGSDGVITYPIEAEGRMLHLQLDEVTERVLVVSVVNTGRMPTSVTKWQIRLGESGYTLPGAPNSPSLPHRLDVGDEAHWYVPLREMVPACVALEKTFGKITEMRARATITGGTVRQSRTYPPIHGGA
jgi:hypothetical protein